jgi:hypothetical protein
MIDVFNFVLELFAAASIRAIAHSGYSLWLGRGSAAEGPPNQQKIPQPPHAARCVAASTGSVARILMLKDSSFFNRANVSESSCRHAPQRNLLAISRPGNASTDLPGPHYTGRYFLLMN